MPLLVPHVTLPMGVWVVIVVIGLGFALFGTVKGFSEAPPVEQFQPRLEIEKQFLNSLPQVLSAYRQAVALTSGMSISSEGDSWLFIDSRPSAMILNGDYGSLVRVEARPSEGGTSLLIQYAPKSTTNLVSNYEGAFREKERALRMLAKQSGSLSEVV